MNQLRANLNLLAVSAAAKETAINTPQATSQSLLVSTDNYIQEKPRLEPNTGETTGLEEATMLYDKGQTSELALTFNRMQPNQAAFILAYGLGGAVSSAVSGTGRLHTIKPIIGDLDQSRGNPSFTAVQRLGNAVEVIRARSMFVNTLTISANADDWVKASASCIGTGYTESSVTEATITALDNVTTLTLPTAIQGANLAAWRDNVHKVRAFYNGAWRYVTPTNIPNATTLTIASMGGTGASITYKVLYNPTNPTWATMPAAISESPLRVSQVCLNVGGRWNSTTSTFDGGQAFSSSLKSFEYSFSNKLAVEFSPCAGGAYAGICRREGREQKLKVSRDLTDMLLKNLRSNNEIFGVQVKMDGPVFDTANNKNYSLELIFPAVSLLDESRKTAKGIVGEDCNLHVLEDALLGSVIARVQNKVTAYAV